MENILNLISYSLFLKCNRKEFINCFFKLIILKVIVKVKERDF